MASISHDKKTGRRTIQFTGFDKIRKTVRLGKVTQKQAESARGYIEDLLGCKATGSTPQPRTAEWVVNLPETIRQRIEHTGLIEPEERSQCPTLGDWLKCYIDGRRDVKAATSTIFGHTKRNLLTFFEESKRLDDILPGDADNFRIFLQTQEKLADNTVRRRIGIAKQFFRAAIRKKQIADNPFEGQSTLVRENTTRFYFVSREEAQAILDACPDLEWRLIFALCRFGGLRCPSEILRLQWCDIDWEKSRFTVHASKTEHHADGGIRQVPIFPELYSLLRDAYEQAETGDVYIINRYRSNKVNLRTQLGRIIKRAGLVPWQKLFQNLRSTRQTELAEEYPQHVVCRWIGNTQSVATKHYLQITDEHFTRAAQKALHFPVQSTAVSARTGSHGKKWDVDKGPKNSNLRPDANRCKSLQTKEMGVTGLEPVTSSL